MRMLIDLVHIIIKVIFAKKPKTGEMHGGYLRRYCNVTKKKRYDHCIVWERHNGPIPEGMQIHHKNHDRSDNRIENLAMATPMEHKRLHSGCYKNKDGEWMKPCRRCGSFKLLETEFYKKGKDSTYPKSVCIVCYNFVRSKYYKSKRY